jgi:hypothetical protein
MIVRTPFYEFKVSITSKSSPEWEAGGKGENASGFTDFDSETIYIRDDLTPAMRADTLLHEMVHVALLAGGIAEDRKYTEEEYVCITTAGLKQLLTADNDEVMEYLGMNL